MTEILFYHLERGRLEDVLPGLLEKTLERGWRAVVQTGTKERTEMLDSFLWTYRDESFLPHAMSGDRDANPVWLTADPFDAEEERDVLFLVDGAAASPDTLNGLERCVMIFDGRDDDALGPARSFWKDGAAKGMDVTYWRQSDQGRWEKQS